MVMAVALFTISCSHEEAQAQPSTQYMDINISIDGKTLPLHLVDNSATRELVAALRQAPITFEADDYGGFEKVGALGRSLPTDNEQITTVAGDVVLYSGNQIVMFYGSNSWSYTRLGRIAFPSPDELRTFLKAGQGRISVTLSLAEATAVKSPSAHRKSGKSYTLNGIPLKQEPSKGIFIKDGRKKAK